MCSKADTRLLNKAVCDFPQQYGIRCFSKHDIKPYATADEVLKDVGKVAMVTGCTRYSTCGRCRCCEVMLCYRFESGWCLASHDAHVMLSVERS